ncbi:winged helix-turn-helix transcriptional regulator [Sandaracinobacter neustonicus]|uniref:Winged helix-turn-helix transcriptional regulator n=1 Tax=Sandaracinobacter neustonicus TaxID=1715348 RepID=A0A501XH57_9SPHN|nr:MarR family winged helix-turn-helix transcriptional regulator [Sandaracinobacter neustonicus]TPE59749.1 winged helix-turn-helix transcriptional regulator [Sandaracinobacter neustonicus]
MTRGSRTQSVQAADAVLRYRADSRGANGDDISGRDGFGAMAQALYAERRHRGKFFNSALFAEPAWDMLLDLRVRVGSPHHPSVSSACIGSAAPASTALRHLLMLESEGLVERSVDPTDARRKLTWLSSDGRRLMDAYLSEVSWRSVSKILR